MQLVFRNLSPSRLANVASFIEKDHEANGAKPHREVGGFPDNDLPICITVTHVQDEETLFIEYDEEHGKPLREIDLSAVHAQFLKDYFS